MNGADCAGIIGTGGGDAIASKGALGVQGAYLWKLKDRIDRVFMAAYQDLPDMEVMMKAREDASTAGTGGVAHRPPGGGGVSDVARSMGAETIEMLSKAKMRCGGCGSKVGAQVLSRALSRVKEFACLREEVLTAAGGS